MNTVNNNKTYKDNHEFQPLSIVESDDKPFVRHELSPEVIGILESEAETEMQLRKKERIDQIGLSNTSLNTPKNKKISFANQHPIEKDDHSAKKKSSSVSQSRRGGFAFSFVLTLLVFLFFAVLYSSRQYISDAVPVLEPIFRQFDRIVEDAQLWVNIKLGFGG
ncbi:MAG: hypothetical protein OXC62_14850 [Aestuariivita sp.]|nr:hypothetical protein [Aestuariivita sp.]